MPVPKTHARHRLRRFLPLVAAGSLLSVAGLAAPLANDASAACSVSSRLSQGQRGSDQVRCLQRALGVGADGYFGPQTKAAVMAYQSSHGLAVEGWVGSQTARSLGIWNGGQVAAARSSTRTARTTSTRSTGRSGVNWDNVARCESGGQWGHGTVTNHVGTFSGGLMIMNSAWRQFGGTQFAPTAGQASRGEQIIVAERIAARVGAARAWQCPVG
jgi:Transglycosylase-like domain/Putative peptidoglycan binding domain